MATQRLAVIILSWNSPEDVLECVESVKEALLSRHSERSEESPGFLPVRQAGFAHAHDDTISIVIVDNGSDARTREIVAKIPGTTYLQTGKNLGFGGGNNIGIKWALTNQKSNSKNQKKEIKYVMLLNQDTVVHPECFTKLLEAVERDQKIGVAGPLIFDYRNKEKLIFAGGKLNWLKTKGRHLSKIPEFSTSSNKNSSSSGAKRSREVLEPYDVDYVTGGALLARRELIETIGLLPEEYFLYFEDVEWNWKAQKAGYRTVVVPNANIWHKVSTTAKAESPAYIQYHIRNGFRFAWRTSGLFKRLIILVWSVLLFGWQMVQLVMKRKPAWRISILKGLVGFWVGHSGEIKK